MDLIQKSKQAFQTKPVQISDLAPVTPVRIAPKQAHLVESPLDDKTNENSCILTSFEVAFLTDRKANKVRLLNQVLMNYLQEPFFSDLRTQQQIGYVVFCRHVCLREVIGCQFLVQSADKSCEHQIAAVNKFLVEFKDKVKNMTDEEFAQQVEAVKTTVAEKDINLSKENSRFWGEISVHKY